MDLESVLLSKVTKNWKKNIYNFSLKYGTYPLMCVMCI